MLSGFLLTLALKKSENHFIVFQGSSEETKKWVWDVTGAMIKGLKRGQTDFKTKVNLIATCIRGYSKLWYDETLELLLDKSFHDGWIAGIDIAALPDTSCGKSVTLSHSAIQISMYNIVHLYVVLLHTFQNLL
jgi:hypothetical protein